MSRSIRSWYVSVHLRYCSEYRLFLQVAELRSRGWSRSDLVGLAGGNFIRVFKGAEAVARRLQREGTLPAVDIYEERQDL